MHGSMNIKCLIQFLLTMVLSIEERVFHVYKCRATFRKHCIINILFLHLMKSCCDLCEQSENTDAYTLLLYIFTLLLYENKHWMSEELHSRSLCSISNWFNQQMVTPQLILKWPRWTCVRTSVFEFLVAEGEEMFQQSVWRDNCGSICCSTVGKIG